MLVLAVADAGLQRASGGLAKEVVHLLGSLLDMHIIIKCYGAIHPLPQVLNMVRENAAAATEDTSTVGNPLANMRRVLLWCQILVVLASAAFRGEEAIRIATQAQMRGHQVAQPLHSRWTVVVQTRR